MFLVNGNRKFLLDFEAYEFPFVKGQDEDNQWLKMRLVIIDGEQKFETIDAALTIDELYSLSRWFLSVVERPFKVLEKLTFKEPHLSFEYFPDKYDIENRAQYLKITFSDAFNPHFNLHSGESDDSDYIIEGTFPRPQLNIALNHLKRDYAASRSRIVNNGDLYPLSRNSEERSFREFLFYNYENPQYEYLRDNFFLNEVEKNVSSIINSFYMVGECIIRGRPITDNLTVVSVMASQRTNLFEENLFDLLKIAAIPHPAWHIIYEILGWTAVYYGLNAVAAEIFLQGLKTAEKVGEKELYSKYKDSFEEALKGFSELCRKSFLSVGIDSVPKSTLVSMLPLALYLYSEHGITAFDKIGTFQLVYESARHHSAVNNDYDLTVGCCIFCALLIQLIFGNPLFNNPLEKVQKQMKKFIRTYQEIFPQDSYGYIASFDKFRPLFSEDFYNNGKNASDGFADSFFSDDSSAEDLLASVIPAETDDKVFLFDENDSEIVSTLKIAVWCNMNYQDFDECISKAKEFDKTQNKDAVAVAAILAFWGNREVQKSQTKATAEDVDADKTDEESFPSRIANVVESNLRRMIEM